ncbi:uncharacterized protein LOC121367599 [Gigantopelta aegis]|uniref:uncharacterized protein LOC121367599 n=1 Tax=Gigantopelta aegis TaxID=1735272 RepID=UPI001B88A498|nr:uncharacterized protein LOC121367599 [Gigantopelta aegis]
MDFNDFLSDLRTAGQEFNEKISDKYAATMAYCETACKGLDRLERDAGPYENQVIGLWVFLGYIQETYPKLTSGPAINALCQKIFRHCARTVLNIKWQQLDENSTSRQNFKVTLQNLNQCLSATGYTRFSLILTLMDSGWTRPILSQVMGGEEDTEDGEGLNYIINEDPVILKIRVELMLQENCEEFALNLCSWCLKHPALKDDLDIRQTQLMLFHKLNNSDRLQEECQKIPCHDGVRLISRMRQMEKYKSLCTRLAQIFLVQDWIRQSEHCCTKDLLKLWIRHQYLADRDKEKFLKSVWAIAKLSSATNQILLMIDALKLECGDMFLQLYTDLCIFALNFDKSCLEKHMQDGDMEGLRSRQQAMAGTCKKLANVYLKNDTKIARYSAVTSFALNPSSETLSFVETFYLNLTVPYVIDRGKQTHDDEKCCTNCFRGEGTCRYKKSEGNQSDANVDIATLLEVERLLTMLRPFYLNPDMKWTELRPLCQRFLHERERLAQKFALEIAETCAADVGNKSVAEAVPSSPAPSTAPPASVLIQASSTTNTQQQKPQSAHTLVIKSEKPDSYLPQKVHAATTKLVPQDASKLVPGQQQNFSKHVSRPVSTQQTVPRVTKAVSSQYDFPHVTRPASVQQNVPHVTRPVSVQQTVPHVTRPASLQQTIQQYVNRPVSSHQNVSQHVTKPLSLQQTVPQHVSRPVSTHHVSQHTVTRETYSSPISVSSQQSLGTVQQDTNSLVGIEPSVMLSEDKHMIIRNLLFTNEDVSLADFPDADALVELLQQALPGGGTELPETLQDITMDNTGVAPAVHIVQESISEQMKRVAQTDSNFVSIYSAPATAPAVQTSLCNTSHVTMSGRNINATHNLIHSSTVPSFSVPVSSMPLSSQAIQSSSAMDVAALVNLQSVLEMPQIGMTSLGHSQKQPRNQSLSYVTVVTQAEHATSSAYIQNTSVSRSNIPIQPKVTQSRVLRPGVAGVVHQRIGAGQQPVQAMMTTNLQKVSSQTQGAIRMAAVGSQIKHNTSVRSLHLSSLPGKPVVTPKSYPNVSSSTEHSDTTVAQKTEQIHSQQQSVSSSTQNSLKNLFHQQSIAASKAGNAPLLAQQIVSGMGPIPGQLVSFDPEYAGSVQNTVQSLAARKPGLMQNILTGGSVQVIPSPSSMMLNAAGVANITQTSANVTSQPPTILYTTPPPSSISMQQSVPNFTQYSQAVPNLDMNQQALQGTADISSVIALLNLQSQLISQTNSQPGSKPNATKTLKKVFNEIQKNKIKKQNPVCSAVKTSHEKDHVNVKVAPNSSKETNLLNQLKVGISTEMPKETVLSMHLHGIPVQFAPPPSASVLEQTVTCANEPIPEQNTIASAALFQHLQPTQPALVQQGQQVQHLVGSLSQLQQSSVSVIPSTGQTQNSLVHSGQTIFIPAAGQQNTAALFQPTTVGQLTLVHQVPSQALFSQPGVLQTGIQISNVSQLSVAKESSTTQVNKKVSNSKTVSEVSFSASNQVSTGDVTPTTSSSVSKAHVPFMLASRLCSSSSKKYNLSSSQSKCSQKTKSNLKDLPAVSKAADFPSFPISSKSSEVTSQLERFLLNSLLPKQSTAVSSQLQNGVQSAEPLHIQSVLPPHSYTPDTQTNTQSLYHNHLIKKSDTVGLLDCLGVKGSGSAFISVDGVDVPVGFSQQQGSLSTANSTATDSSNNSLHVLASKSVQESVLDKCENQVDGTFFSQNKSVSKNTLQKTDLTTMDQPYLIENVSSLDLAASQAYDASEEFSKLSDAATSKSCASVTADDSKSDVQKKRIVSKRLFATKFKCMICSEVFENMDDLRSHVRNPCTPGLETSMEKFNRISACEEALKQKSPYSGKCSSDKVPQVTKKSLEASRVYECPVCKVLCKTDEEVLHHRFGCLKSKSKPRQRKPKVSQPDISTTSSDPPAVTTSSVMTDLSAGVLQHDTSFSSGPISLTALSPLSHNSGGMVSPVTTAIVSSLTLPAVQESPVSTSVASSLSSTPPAAAAFSGDNASCVRPVKFVGHKPTKEKKSPHTGLLGARPKPPPKPMTPERIADLLLVWRTVEWVRAALGVAAPSFRIKALDLARSSLTPSTESDSQLVEALDIDKSVVPKIKLYEEKQKKLKNKKRKASPKADSSFESISSVKSFTKKEKAPPKKKKEALCSVNPDGKKTEKSSDSQQSSPVKKKKAKKNPEPKFQVLEHLGRKYYKCGLCGQTFCNLDFMVSEHWEKCLSQNPKQRKSKPGGPGDKKVQKTKTNKDAKSAENTTGYQSTGEATEPTATEKNEAVVSTEHKTELKLQNTPKTESNNQSAVKESVQEKSSTDQLNPVSSLPKVESLHIDFAALLKETFSNALGKRMVDTVNPLGDKSNPWEHSSTDMIPDQSNMKILERIEESASTSVTSESFSVPSSQPIKTELLPFFGNDPGLESVYDDEPNVARIESSTVLKPQEQVNQNEYLRRYSDDSVMMHEVDSNTSGRTLVYHDEDHVAHTPQPVEETSGSDLCHENPLPPNDYLSTEMIKTEMFSSTDVKLTCDEVLEQMPLSLSEDDKSKEDAVNSSMEQRYDGKIDNSSETFDLSTQLHSDEDFRIKEKEEKSNVNLQIGLSNEEAADNEKSIGVQPNDEDVVHSVDRSADVDHVVDRPCGSSSSDEQSSVDEIRDKPCSPATDESGSGDKIRDTPCDGPCSEEKNSDKTCSEEKNSDDKTCSEEKSSDDKTCSEEKSSDDKTYSEEKNSDDNTCLEEKNSDDKTCLEEKNSDDKTHSEEKNSYDKTLDMPLPTSDGESHSDKMLDESCDTPTSDEDSDVTKKQISDENQSEKEADKSDETTTIDSAVLLGKKRPVLDRDAKNMNSSSSFMLNKIDDSNTGSDVSCDACGALFRHVRTLIQHMVSRHLHPKKWTAASISSIVCPFCDLTCRSYMIYMNHLPKHTTVILEKMRQHLLSDEKKSQSKTRTQHTRVAEVLKGKQKKEDNSDLASIKKVQNHSKQTSLDAVDTDVDVKMARKRGRPRKYFKTEVENVENEDDPVQSDVKPLFPALDDSASMKEQVSCDDDSAKEPVKTDVSLPSRQTRSRTSRELRHTNESQESMSLVNSKAKLTRSRKRSLSPVSTPLGHHHTKTAKLSSTDTDNTSSDMKTPGCKTRSLGKEMGPKKGSPSPTGSGQRKSSAQQTRKNLIKAAQAHVIQRKKAAFASHNSSEKKQTSYKKKETGNEKINEQEQISRKSYSLRNAAHLYIKSRQNVNALDKSTVLAREKKNDQENPINAKRKTSCKKDLKTQSIENDGDEVSTKSCNVEKDMKCSRKLRIQFAKRYDETSICFNKKDKCWQAFDRVSKTWKLLSSKHFVGLSKHSIVKEKRALPKNAEKCVSKEQTEGESILEEEQKSEHEVSCESEAEVKTESMTTVPIEDKCEAEFEKPVGLRSPSSFQDSYMSYLCQFSSESNSDDAEVTEAQESDTQVLTPPKKELQGIKTLRGMIKSESFSWDVGDDGGKTPSKEESVCDNRNEDTLSETKSGLKLTDGVLEGNNKIGSGFEKENEKFDHTCNKDLTSSEKNENYNQKASLTIKSVEESDNTCSAVNMVSEIAEDKNPQQSDIDVSEKVNAIVDKTKETFSNSVEGNDSCFVDESKSDTIMRQPKSLRSMAASMQPPNTCLKSDMALATGMKSSGVTKAEAEPVGKEVPSKIESKVSGKEKTSHGAMPQLSDTEEDEDETKTQRIQRSLKSLREKSNVAPFTWDVDEDEHPASKISRTHVPTEQRNESRETIHTKAVSVGTSPRMGSSPPETFIRTRFRHFGEGMKSDGFRKVTRSCSSESLFNKVSHTQSASCSIPTKTDIRSILGKETKSRPISVGTDQSYRTRSCDQRSSDLNNYLQRKVKLEVRPEDDANITACRKRRISKSEESQERKCFGMAAPSSKESVVRARYGSPRGQHTFSNVESLPAVVRRSSHRLTSPVYPKSSVSNVQFYRVAPTEEPKGDSLRNTRSVKPPFEERTRHTLVMGEHVQCRPQLCNSGGKKIDQKWVIDKRKHKKASFPYAFTRIGNQRK